MPEPDLYCADTGRILVSTPEGLFMGKKCITLEETRRDWEGFHAIFWNTEPDPATSVSFCQECRLLRWRFKGRGEYPSCSDYHRYCYLLDAWNLEGSHFKKYREDIEKEIKCKKIQEFFRDRFLDALKWYPELSYEDFFIRITIGVTSRKVEVTSVVLEEPMSRRRGMGNIVLTFEVRSKNSRVSFDVEMLVPLKRRGLRPATTGKSWRLDGGLLNWGHEFADVLSDKEPSSSFSWQVSQGVSNKISDPTCDRHKSHIIRSLGKALSRNFRFFRN